MRVNGGGGGEPQASGLAAAASSQTEPQQQNVLQIYSTYIEKFGYFNFTNFYPLLLILEKCDQNFGGAPHQILCVYGRKYFQRPNAFSGTRRKKVRLNKYMYRVKSASSCERVFQKNIKRQMKKNI